MSYTHLTREERYQTWALLGAGYSQRQIARRLGRSPSTVCREIRRNCGQRGYRSKQAHNLAQDRASTCRRRPRITPEQWRCVAQLIRRDWSPEQIAERTRLEGAVQISHEWIYQFIYADKQLGGDLHRHLRCQKKRRKRYGGGRQHRGRIVDRLGIEHRPRAADERSEIGHWETDTIIGKGKHSTCLTAVERLSRFTRLAKLHRRTARVTTRRLCRRLKPLVHAVHTITGDNGKEFSDHRRISAGLDCEFYFADPYASWQRGTNENTNGLIRQYLPRSRDMNTLTGGEIQKIEKRLNQRPRKCLGYLTPHEVFYDTRLKLTVAPRS
jgi:transposase, IS30 family